MIEQVREAMREVARGLMSDADALKATIESGDALPEVADREVALRWVANQALADAGGGIGCPVCREAARRLGFDPKTPEDVITQIEILQAEASSPCGECGEST